MDAKKLKKAKNIKLNQAQNICARANGLDLDWDDAIVFLKKKATAKYEEELASLGGLMVGAYKDAFQSLDHKNEDFDVLNYQPSAATVVHGSVTSQELVDALKRMDLESNSYSNWLKNTIKLVESNGLDSTFSESGLKRFQDPVWLLRMAKDNQAMHSLFSALIPNYNGLLTKKTKEVLTYLVLPINDAASNVKQLSVSSIAPQVIETLAIERKHNIDGQDYTQSPSDFGKIFETEPADITFEDIVKSGRAVVGFEEPTEHFFTSNSNNEQSSERTRSNDLEALHMLTTGSGVRRVKPFNEIVINQSKFENMAVSLDKYAIGLITLFGDGTLLYDPKVESLPISNFGGEDSGSFEDFALSLIERGIVIKGSEPRTGLSSLQMHDAKNYKAMCDELGAAITHKLQHTDSVTVSGNGHGRLSAAVRKLGTKKEE